MSVAQTALTAGRTLYLSFLVAAFLLFWVPTLAPHDQNKILPAVIVVVLGAVALMIMGAAWYFRMRLVQPACQKLQADPEDTTAAIQWRTGLIISLAFCESVILIGLSLKFLGAGWNVAGIFYAVGVLLMLAWWPRLDLPPQ